MSTQPIPDQMNVIAITEAGGPETLKLAARPVPSLSDGEVLIRVAAAGVNGPDILQRRGRYDPPPGHSDIPGLEVAGEIVQTGANAAHWAVGDKVVALCNGGGYAEYVAVPAGQVLPLPDNWTFVGGASLPETFFTIQQTLVDRAGLAAGMTILVHGGAGGLGATAIQIAHHAGATVIATVSSPRKASYVLELGADHLIAYSREDFVERTLEVTNGHGADRIIDIVGAEYLDRHLKVAAQGATLLFLSRLGGSRSALDIATVMSKGLTMMGSLLRPQPLALKTAVRDHLLTGIWPALNDGTIRPQRIETFDLENASDAHSAMEGPDHLGKIILVTPFGRQQIAAQTA